MKLTREMLVGLLAGQGERLGIDISDQYQCYAFVHLRFTCINCGKELQDNQKDLGSLEWCKATASRAVELGWYVPLPNQGIYELEALCPECVSMRELRV